MVETSPDSQIAFFPSSALLLQMEQEHSGPRFFSGQALLIKYIKKLLIESPKSNIFRTVTFHRPEHFLVHFRCFQMRSISDPPPHQPQSAICLCPSVVVVENLEAIKFSISYFCANDKLVSRCQRGRCVDEFSFTAKSKKLKDEVQGIISVFSKMSRMSCVGHVCPIFKNLTSIMGLLHYSH